MEIEIIRSRRKSIAIQVCPDGHVRVRAPYRTKKSEIMTFIRKESEWIEKQQNLRKEYQKKIANIPPISMQELHDLADQALAVLPERVQYFAEQIGVDYGRITIRNQRTRWGSCSGKGNLNFNCLLMLAPAEIQDYVIVHELCHRKEMNHSPAFWAEVAKIIPDYRQKRKWLRENGSILMARMEQGGI